MLHALAPEEIQDNKLYNQTKVGNINLDTTNAIYLNFP